MVGSLNLPSGLMRMMFFSGRTSKMSGWSLIFWTPENFSASASVNLPAPIPASPTTKIAAVSDVCSSASFCQGNMSTTIV